MKVAVPDLRRLFKNRCPSCNADLANASFDSNTNLISCAKKDCGYSITQEEMQAILARGMNRQIAARQP